MRRQRLRDVSQQAQVRLERTRDGQLRGLLEASLERQQRPEHDISEQPQGTKDSSQFIYFFFSPSFSIEAEASSLQEKGQSRAVVEGMEGSMRSRGQSRG